MDQDLGNRWRLDPRVIIAAVREEQPRSYQLARITLGVGVATFIVLVSGPPLLSWPLLVGLLVGIIVAAITDGRALLQLGAEITGATRKAPRALRSRRRGDEVITAGIIEPGFWICHFDDYEERRSKAEEEYRQRQGDHERREDERIAIARELWIERKKEDAKRGVTYPKYYRPPELERRPFYESKYMPRKDFRLAVVTYPPDDSQTVSLGIVRGRTRHVPSGEKFYAKGPKAGPPMEDEQIDVAATALVDVAKSLQSRPVAEEEIILILQDSYALCVIRRALRGALATNLIKRGRDPARLLCELLYMFHLISSHTVQRRRKTKLTELGQMWIAADRAAKEAAAHRSGAADMKGAQVTHNEFKFFGRPIFYNSPFGSTVHYGSHTEIHVDVKGILARTVEILESRRDRIRQVSDPEALEEAISELRAVLDGQQPADSRITPALKVIIRIGEGLFLGVAGNALYSEILQLIQIFSKK